MQQNLNEIPSFLQNEDKIKEKWNEIILNKCEYFINILHKYKHYEVAILLWGLTDIINSRYDIKKDSLKSLKSYLILSNLLKKYLKGM